MNNHTEESGFVNKNHTRLFTLTLAMVCISTLILLTGAAIYFASLALDLFSPVLWPLAVAGILAVLLNPIVGRFESWSGFSRPLVIFIIYILVTFLLFVGLWTIGGEIVQQFQMLIKDSSTWPDRIETKIRNSVSGDTWIIFSQWFENFKGEWQVALSSLSSQTPQIAKSSGEVIRSAWEGASSFFGSFACLAVFPVYLFYFLSSRSNYLVRFIGQLVFVKPGIRDDLLYLSQQFKEIMEAFFRGQFIIGAMMGVGYAIGFSICGLQFGLALGLLFGMLNVVPFLGSVVGVVTTLLVAYLQPAGILESGEMTVLYGCGATFLIVQLLESYWLSPKVMGERTGLHPVAIIASVFFWGIVFGGVLGMILGIPLTAFLIIFWRLMKKKYLTG